MRARVELALDGNPVADLPAYRSYVLLNLKNLRHLDMKRITEEVPALSSADTTSPSPCLTVLLVQERRTVYSQAKSEDQRQLEKRAMEERAGLINSIQREFVETPTEVSAVPVAPVTTLQASATPVSAPGDAAAFASGKAGMSYCVLVQMNRSLIRAMQRDTGRWTEMSFVCLVTHSMDWIVGKLQRARPFRSSLLT